MVKRDSRYHALAVKTQGREVLDELVLESDDFRPVVLDVFDRASREWMLHGIDPFAEEK